MKAAVSYNVHGCRGRDRVHDIERCVAVVAGVEPALVGLQEVDSREGQDVWRAFESALDMQAIPGPTLTGAAGHYGNLLLTRYRPLSVTHCDLSVDGREPRRAIDAVVAAPDGPLRVIVTHFGLAFHERRVQLRRLKAALAARWRGQPTLLLGDFNEWLPVPRVGRRVHPLLCSGRLPRSFPSSLPLFALDQIWWYPASLVARVHALDNRMARLASDHLPLVASFAGSRPDGASVGG